MNTQTYTVNIRTGVVNITRVDVSQGDTGRTLAFKLYDGLIPFTPPTGSTVTIVGRKPSGLGFSETCTVSGNTAVVNTTLAMTQESGKFPVELKIESDTRSIGTANFVMHVEPSPHPAGTTDGTTEEARTVLAQCEAYAQIAQEAAEASEESVQEAVDEWLDEHPEAVVALADNSVTEAKIHASAVSNTKIQNGAVTDDKTADTYKNLFYDEVTVSTGRASNTDYYLATVPKLDSENNIIPVSLSYDVALNPLEQAWEKGSTMTVNGYCSVLYNGEYKSGIVICDGTVVHTRSYEGVAPDNILYIGMKPDRTIVEYKMNSSITPSQMLADGCTNVFNCYFKLVENGQIVEGLSNGTIAWNNTTVTEDLRNPLMLMGVKPNNDIIFLACDGRTIINDGLTYREAGNILISQGCDTVYNLDGGGSTCLVVKGSKLNRNIDDNGTTIRNIHYALNVIKQSANTPTKKAYEKIGEEKQKIVKQIIPHVNAINDAIVTRLGTAIPANSDLDDFLTEGKYHCASAAVAGTLSNCPVASGFSLYCLQQGNTGRAITQMILKNPSSSNGVQTIHYRTLIKDTNDILTTVYDWNQFSPSTKSFTLEPKTGVTINRSKCTMNGRTVTISCAFTTSEEMAKNAHLFAIQDEKAIPTSTVDIIVGDKAFNVNYVCATSSGYIDVSSVGPLPAGTYRMNTSWQVA